jgi:hypothetical protein
MLLVGNDAPAAAINGKNTHGISWLLFLLFPVHVNILCFALDEDVA